MVTIGNDEHNQMDMWVEVKERKKSAGCMHRLGTNEEELENVSIIAMYRHLRPPDAIAFPN